MVTFLTFSTRLKWKWITKQILLCVTTFITKVQKKSQTFFCELNLVLALLFYIFQLYFTRKFNKQQRNLEYFWGRIPLLFLSLTINSCMDRRRHRDYVQSRFTKSECQDLLNSLPHAKEETRSKIVDINYVLITLTLADKSLSLTFIMLASQ